MWIFQNYKWRGIAILFLYTLLKIFWSMPNLNWSPIWKTIKTGNIWVIPQSYQHYCVVLWSPHRKNSTCVKNGFGLRSGLLSTTRQVQCSRGLCELWHIFITQSRDSSEAVLLIYGGLMVLILSFWVMKLFQGWW